MNDSKLFKINIIHSDTHESVETLHATSVTRFWNVEYLAQIFQHDAQKVASVVLQNGQRVTKHLGYF